MLFYQLISRENIIVRIIMKKRISGSGMHEQTDRSRRAVNDSLYDSIFLPLLVDTAEI